MSFLFPAFLLGALAVAIPIFLHLSKRDVAPRVAFSDVRFLKHAPMMRSRRRRLRELLLLALRVTALVLLALAFARPFYDSTGMLDRDVTIVALDTSASMTFPGGFDRARAEARAAITAVPSGHAVGVVTFDDRLSVVSKPSLDRAAAMSAVERTSPGFGGTRYGGALEAAVSLIGSRGGQVVVVTDLQRAGWEAGSDLTVSSRVNVIVRDVGSASDNLAVTAVELSAAGVVGVVVNGGVRERTSTVRVHVDGTVVDTAEAALPPGFTEVVFDMDLPSEGVLDVEVDDPEGLAADNRRYLLLDPSAQVPVLIVAEGASGDETFYLERALGGGGAAGLFRVRSVRSHEMSDAALDGVAVVVLMGTAGLDRTARRQLATFVADGAGLLIVGGPALDPAVAADVLGTPLMTSHVAEQESPAMSWSVTDPRHPVFERFGAAVGMLGGVRFRQTVGLDDVSGRVLAAFSSGAPALVEYMVGRGHALVFGSDLGNEWNDFPRLPAFVPFIHEITRYLSGYREEAGDLVVADAPPGVDPVPGVQTVPSTARRVVLNVDARESDTSRVTADGFQERIRVMTAPPRAHGAPDGDAAGREAEQEYWWYVIALMLGVLVVEAWLGRTAA